MTTLYVPRCREMRCFRENGFDIGPGSPSMGSGDRRLINRLPEPSDGIDVALGKWQPTSPRTDGKMACAQVFPGARILYPLVGRAPGN